MRPTHVPAVALVATLAAVPALAQNASDARATPPAADGQELGERQAQAPSEPGNPLLAMRAGELVGQTIFGANGQEIGEVDQVVVDRRGNPAAVVGVGGFLGIGERAVAIPLDQLEPHPGDRLITGMTREQIGSMTAFDTSAYQPVESGTTIAEAANG